MFKCCGAKPTVVYKHENKTYKIPKKAADTIGRFARGKIARMEVDKLKKNKMEEITSLKLTDIKKFGNIDQELINHVSDKGPLLTDKQLADFMEKNPGLKWDNTSQNIGDGHKYRGHWNEHRSSQEGIGEIHYKDGSLYQGQVKACKPHGKGRMTHTDGDIYQGNWVDGKASGYGTFIDDEGSIYEGPWVDDKQHGQGKEMWEKATKVYKGEFAHGEKNGQGQFSFNGSVYNGQFQQGQMHGMGKYYFADDGKIYEGQFEDNNMHGKGLLKWPNLQYYDGDFKNGMMDGQGTLWKPDGNRIQGSFKNDKPNGVGVLYSFKDQTKRQGTWEAGKRTQWLRDPIKCAVSHYGDQKAVIQQSQMSGPIIRTKVQGKPSIPQQDPNSSTMRNRTSGVTNMYAQSSAKEIEKMKSNHKAKNAPNANTSVKYLSQYQSRITGAQSSYMHNQEYSQVDEQEHEYDEPSEHMKSQVHPFALPSKDVSQMHMPRPLSGSQMKMPNAPHLNMPQNPINTNGLRSKLRMTGLGLRRPKLPQEVPEDAFQQLRR